MGNLCLCLIFLVVCLLGTASTLTTTTTIKLNSPADTGVESSRQFNDNLQLHFSNPINLIAALFTNCYEFFLKKTGIEIPCTRADNTTCVVESGIITCVCIACHQPIGNNALKNGCEPNTALPTIECSGCDGTANSVCPDLASGIINSPNYPANYDDNTCLVWILRASEGSRIEITINDFVMEGDEEECDDSLEIRDGELENSPLQVELCGNPTVPISFTSFGTALRLQFESDGGEDYRGFTLCARQI